MFIRVISILCTLLYTTSTRTTTKMIALMSSNRLDDTTLFLTCRCLYWVATYCIANLWLTEKIY